MQICPRICKIYTRLETENPAVLVIANMKVLIMKIGIKLITHLAALTLFIGCATNTATTNSQNNKVEMSSQKEPSEANEEIVYGAFTQEQLYQTIISELGAQRGDFNDAGETYLDLAIETKDLAIIQRALSL